MPRTCVSAAAPGLPDEPRLSRRSLLAALPAAGALTLTAPSLAQAEDGDTEIMRLFRQHRAIMKAGSEYDWDRDDPDVDEELDRLFYSHTDQLENAILSLPCTCAADFAAKMIVSSSCGQLIDDWEEGEVWQEARTLTGLHLDGYRISDPVRS